MTQGIKSHGTKLGIGDQASPEGFVDLTEGTVIPRLGGTKGTIDFSNHDSVDFKEFKTQDLAEGEQLEVQANYIPGDTAQGAFKAAYDDETTNYYRYTLKDGTTFIFQGICLGWHVDPSELDGKVNVFFSVKPVGTITEDNPT